MLRITTHDRDNLVTLELEGKLAGPWVALVRESWQQQLARGCAIQIDLRAVTYVDALGKALLAEMTGRHAQLIACDCQMKAILAELARTGATSA
jgi:ABC-type transporter Mla MlaB component